MANEPRFETYPWTRTVDPDSVMAGREPTGEYGWRFRDANGKVTFVGGEGFEDRHNAHRALWGASFDVVRMLLGQSVGLSPAGLLVRDFEGVDVGDEYQVEATYRDVRLYETGGGKLEVHPIA